MTAEQRLSQAITNAISVTNEQALQVGDFVVTHVSQKICKITAINSNVATIQESAEAVPIDVALSTLGALGAIQFLMAHIVTGPIAILGIADGAPDCRACGAPGAHTKLIPLFDGQVLPPTWQGDWTHAVTCAACYARQQALLHPVTLMVFRHMRKDVE